MSVTRSLAEFVVKSRYEDLPQEVVCEAKLILLDSIGCALGAHSIEKGSIAVNLSKELGGKPEATIIGSGEKVSVSNAAFANGELISGLDNDPGVQGHIPPFTIPPAIAMTERMDAAGAELILSAVIGWEVGSRVLNSMPGQRSAVYPILEGRDKERKSALDFSWACTIMGAAAAAGKALDLNIDQMEDAFGLAAHMCPVQGWASQSLSPPVGMHKFDMAGWIAQAGVVAALLAQKGYTAHKSVLDGDHGFWWFYGAVKCDLDSIVRDLGKEWKTLKWTANKYPICGAMGASLGAFIKILEEEKIQPDEIETISVKIDPLFNLPMWLNNDVKTSIDAQFSIAYPFAAAAYYPLPSGLGPLWQTRKVMNDPKVRQFMQKIDIGFYDKALFPLSEYPGARTGLVDVNVTARRKTYKKEGFWKSQWHQDSGPTVEELYEKFTVNASSILSPEKVEQSIKKIMELEKINKINELMTSICVS